MNRKIKIVSTIQCSIVFFVIFLWANYEDKLSMKILTIFFFFLLSILIFYIWNKKFANFLNKFF